MKTLVSIFLVVLGLVAVSAQEKKGTPDKKEPESRRIEVPVSPAAPSTAQQTPPLPKIDLPEYIITGIASLSMSDVDKEEIVVNPSTVDLLLYRTTVGPRERGTVELEAHQKEFLAMGRSLLQNGQVRASLGNYFTPRVNFWFGQLEQNYDYRIEAGYHRTKGFAANTDQSGGAIGLKGGVLFTSGALQGGRIVGDAGWGTESYRLYGSTTPTLQRERSNAQFGVKLLDSPTGDFHWETGLSYRYVSVRDNAVETDQSHVTLDARANYPVAGSLVEATVKYQSASLSGANTGTVSLLDLGLGTSRIWWKSFFAQASAQLYTAEGMAGQSLSRIYPNATLGYLINPDHLATVSYGGVVEFVDLAGVLQQHPYLGTNAQLRNADRQHRASLTVESDWSPMFRTKSSVSYERVNDLALVVDPAATGISQLLYGGTTQLWNVRTEGFAKLTPNDYVAATVSVNSTNNSMTQLSVPYIPDFEIVGSYTHLFPFGITVIPKVHYQHLRETGMATSQQLPGYLVVSMHADYEPASSLRLFIDLNNIFDKRYDEWKGYQAAPFMVSGGLSFRW